MVVVFAGALYLFAAVGMWWALGSPAGLAVAGANLLMFAIVARLAIRAQRA